MLGIFYAFCIMVFVQYYKCFVIIENKITSICNCLLFYECLSLDSEKMFFQNKSFHLCKCKDRF